MAKRLTDHGEDGRADTRRAKRARASRVDTERAILELSGERGYQNFTVAELLARSGSNRSRFYASWAGKEDCFVSAHAAAADRLMARLLGAGGAAEDWGAGVADALVELGAFTAEAPGLAAGLIGEVHVVGGAALEKRDEVLGHLAQALDRGRDGAPGSDHVPPAATSMLILNAIEASVLRALARRGRLSDELPGLLFLSLVYYRGMREARRAAARLAADRRP
jgi:AcrR family transcriptional regulator